MNNFGNTVNQSLKFSTFDANKYLWISCLSDDLSLSEMSIPGTHNSAAYKIEGSWINRAFTGITGSISIDVWQTQDWTIEQQLRNGIRYFDVRLRMYSDRNTI